MDDIAQARGGVARRAALERVPPHSDEAEISVLGGMLLEESAVDRAMELLTEDDFYHPAHRHIFLAISALRDQGHAPDALSVREELKRHGLFDVSGGDEYLARIVDIVPTAANLPYHARIVQDAAVKRRLIGAGTEIVKDAYEAAEDSDALLNRAEERIFRLGERRYKKAFTPINQLLQGAVMQLESLSARKESITGAPSGFKDLDDLTAGFQLSDLVIVAGRPSMGKTSFALNIAAHAAIVEDLPVAIFSLEMSMEQLVQRLISTEALVSLKTLRTGQASSEQWKNVADACDRLRRAAIYIDDSGMLNALEMRAKARRLKQQRDIGLLVVDYLQLMTSGSRNENRQQEITEISRSLKVLAKELNIPVVALSQLSRAPEHRGDARPKLADLRESGCLTGNTRIYLPDEGVYRGIEELVGRSGFRVLALDTESWKLTPTRVTSVFATDVRPVLRLTTKLGKTIRATGNHRFLSFDGWKPLDEIAIGERIALPRWLPGPQEPTMDRTELALLGRLIGDGCTLPRHSIQYTTRDLFLAENVSSYAIEQFGAAIDPRIHRERNWWQVYLRSAAPLGRGRANPVANWLRGMGAFGYRSYEKRVPQAVFRQPASEIAWFVRHLWAADGCIRFAANQYPSVYYATSSEGLAHDVQSLLLRVEINAVLRRVSQKRGRDQFHLKVSGRDEIRRFLRTIGTAGEQKAEAAGAIMASLASRGSNTNRDSIPRETWRRLVVPAMKAAGVSGRMLQAEMGQEYCGTTLYKSGLSRERARKVAHIVDSQPLQRLADSDVYWDEVISLEADGFEPVYDMTVPGLHNFVAEDVIVHNSIEQDADLVVFLYRDEYYNQETSEKKGIAEVIIGKNRNGPTGAIELAFLQQFMRFENLDRFHAMP